MSKFLIDQLSKFIHRKFSGKIILSGNAVSSAYLVTEAKFCILIASLVSGISGITFLKSTSKSIKQLSSTR